VRLAAERGDEGNNVEKGEMQEESAPWDQLQGERRRTDESSIGQKLGISLKIAGEATERSSVERGAQHQEARGDLTQNR